MDLSGKHGFESVVDGCSVTIELTTFRRGIDSHCFLRSDSRRRGIPIKDRREGRSNCSYLREREIRNGVNSNSNSNLDDDDELLHSTDVPH